MAAIKDPRKRLRGYLYIAVPVYWLDERPEVLIPNVAMGVYIRLYLLAARFNNAGKLIDQRGPLGINEITYLLRCDQEELEESMELLENSGLLEHNGDIWKLPSFKEEQIDLDEQREAWRKEKSLQRNKNRGKTPVEKEGILPGEQVGVGPGKEGRSGVIMNAEPEPSELIAQGSELLEENHEDNRERNRREEEIELEKEIEVEGEVETLRGVLVDSARTPASTAAAVESLFPAVQAEIFKDVYREAKKKYTTDEVLAGIRAMIEVVVLHNLHSEDKWNPYNREMALELCEPARRKSRLERERKEYEDDLPIDEMVRRFLDGKS